jgi:glycerol-3-phosphate acyltransferase PlsY
MQIIYSGLLVAAAFGLGACPFSLWIGKWLLHKDIRNYGDGNPGAFNVFRAGGRWSGVLALVLDIGKGVPFVALALHYFDLPEVTVFAVALFAILGHAFSPILRFDGGKALAVTAGVLVALLPQYILLLPILVFIGIGALFIEIDAWRVIFGIAATLVFVLITKGASVEALFVLLLIGILAARHLDDLRTFPKFRGKLVTWVATRRRHS